MIIHTDTNQRDFLLCYGNEDCYSTHSHTQKYLYILYFNVNYFRNITSWRPYHDTILLYNLIFWICCVLFKLIYFFSLRPIRRTMRFEVRCSNGRVLATCAISPSTNRAPSAGVSSRCSRCNRCNQCSRCLVLTGTHVSLSSR